MNPCENSESKTNMVETTTVETTVDIDDDDIDESFTQKPQVDIKTLEPEELSPEELEEMKKVLNTKSHKELRECLCDFAMMYVKDSQENSMQKMQITQNINKIYGSTSKQHIIDTLLNMLNKTNFHIIIKPKNVQKSHTEDVKPTREELLKKLHNKIKISNKANVQKEYKKLQEEITETETEIDGDANQDKKKKKKKNQQNLQNPQQLQALINQVATYMKNINPTSA